MLGSLHRALFIVVILLLFLGQACPTPGGFPIFLPVAILLAPATLLMRISDEGVPGLLLGDPGFMAIFAFTVLTYIYGVAISVDVQGDIMLREIANGIMAMMVVFSIANSSWTTAERARLVRAAAWGMLFVGLFVAVLGAYKFWLILSKGEPLDFVAVASGGKYPWGTSLVTDYNFYALTSLVAVLSALFLTTYVRPLGQSILALLIFFLIVVGTLAGSRRFWLVTPLILAAQSLWMISRHGVRRYRVVFSLLLLFLVGLPTFVYVVATDVFELLFTGAGNFQYRALSILDSDKSLGMWLRFDRWTFAIARLEGFAPWFGSGFDYVRRFSCEYGDCSGAGYPHMPILSAYLYGGAIAAIAAFVLFIYLTIAGLRLLAHDFEFGWLFFPMLSALLFAAISGNGPLAIRSYIILGAVCVGFLRAIQDDTVSGKAPAVISAA